LGVAPATQIEFFFELFAELPPAALGKEGVLGKQLRARLIGIGGLAIAAHPHVAGSDALNGAALVIEHFRPAKAGKDLDPHLFGTLAQPATDIAQAHDIVAVIAEAVRQQRIGHPPAAALGEEQKAVFLDRHIERRPVRFPVGV
jgi:hypothetical protein